MGEFCRLPQALLTLHILKPSSFSVFALGQTSRQARAVLYDSAQLADLWYNLDMEEFLRDREHSRQQGATGCEGGSPCADAAGVQAPNRLGAPDTQQVRLEEQLTLLLLQLVPAVTRSFRGVATDAVLGALQEKLSSTLETLQVLHRSRVKPAALLSLAKSMGPGLKVLQLACAFELQPGFLAALASDCPNLTELSFSSNTMVLPMTEKWQADPGMMRYHPDSTHQLQEQKHRHAFTLELVQLLARCPALVVLYLPPGLHVCNGVLLAIRRWSQKLQRLHGARINFFSGEGLTWPIEIEQEYNAYLCRQRAAAGLPPLCDQHQFAADSKTLADLTYQTFDDVVRHMVGAAPGATVSLAAPSRCSGDFSGGRVFIDDVAGRRLRIDMQYNAMWTVK